MSCSVWVLGSKPKSSARIVCVPDHRGNSLAPRIVLFFEKTWNIIKISNPKCLSCIIGWRALHEASVGGYYQTAKELLKGGADVNAKGKYQITPLHDAVMNRHYKVLYCFCLYSIHSICKCGQPLLPHNRKASLSSFTYEYSEFVLKFTLW